MCLLCRSFRDGLDLIANVSWRQGIDLPLTPWYGLIEGYVQPAYLKPVRIIFNLP